MRPQHASENRTNKKYREALLQNVQNHSFQNARAHVADQYEWQ